MNKSEFDKLTSDIYDNQNNKDFKITINKKTYDLKNAKKFWTTITKSKLSKNDAKNLYKELIQKDIDALEREKNNSTKKTIFYNLSKTQVQYLLVFICTMERCIKKTIVERNIAENVKLRKRRIAEIKKEEKNINCKLFNEYFINQQSPSDMYKTLCKTEGEWSEQRVFLIREVLNKMKKVIENVHGDRKFKIEENEKINNIVERILYFNQLNQSGKGLKILIPNQMLTRLPISLA